MSEVVYVTHGSGCDDDGPSYWVGSQSYDDLDVALVVAGITEAIPLMQCDYGVCAWGQK